MGAITMMGVIAFLFITAFRPVIRHEFGYSAYQIKKEVCEGSRLYWESTLGGDARPQCNPPRRDTEMLRKVLDVQPYERFYLSEIQHLCRTPNTKPILEDGAIKCRYADD